MANASTLGWLRHEKAELIFDGAMMPASKRGAGWRLRGAGCAAVFAVVMGVAAGCSAPGRARPVVPRVARTAAGVLPPAPPAQPPLPLDRYALTSAQSSEAYYLSLQFMKTCMAGQGFRYLPGLNAADVALGTRISAEFGSRLWGISDPAAAREYGYHLPPWTSGTGVPEPPGKMPAAEQRAYWQCRAQVLRRLPAGGQGQAPQMVAALQADSWYQAEDDRPMRAVFAQWSACMSAHGYRYRNPLQAAAKARLANPVTGAPLPVTRPEVRTAVTDIACKQKTRLLSIAYSVQAQTQDTLIRQHVSQLAQIKALVEQEAGALAILAAKYGILDGA